MINIENLLKVIKNEDKKNPLTDQEIAEIMGVSRAKVSKMRQELDIPSSSDRRKELLYAEIKKIMETSGDNSERNITRVLSERGYTVSRTQVRNIIRDIGLNNYNKIKIVKQNKDENDGFEDLIGVNGSLKEKVSLLKSAMMYPPNGLHTIIYGETGVGKSAVAECMYKFSIKSGFKKSDSPFIVFNCADYAENPNLLISQLFGVEKGAYTGANAAKEGIVEKANGGILFLDEIHRLPSAGQEILFSLIDRGVYRRLGESSSERKATVLLICATTEDPESNLLKTFRRRIPMVIDLPNLENRPKEERYDIILKFFEMEAKRVNKNFIVSKEVLLCLMNYKCSGNIGQLKSDIQVTCARAFSKTDFNDDTVKVSVDSLRRYIRECEYKKDNDFVEDIYIDISEVKNKNGLSETVISEIYQYAEKELKILEKSDYEEDEIKNIFLRKLDRKFNELITNKNIFREDFISYIGNEIPEEIMKIMNKTIEMLNSHYSRINSAFYPALAIHLQHTLKRIREGKNIVNPSNWKIKDKMPDEYEFARYIATMTENMTKLAIPEDELGYIAYYINKFCYKEEEIEEHVKILIATHGKVGIEMSKVVNHLLGLNCTTGIEIPIDIPSSEGIEKCIEEISKIRASKGMVILIDMGSLVILSDEVEKRFGIKARTVSRIDTMLAMEIAKMASFECKSVDEIIEYCDNARKGSQNTKNGAGSDYAPDLENSESSNKKEDIIVTACLSGDGNAQKLKQILDKEFTDKGIDIKVLPMAFFDEIDITSRLDDISKKYNIVCIIGTMDIMYKNTPFINYSRIMSKEGIDYIEKMILNERKHTDKSMSANQNLKDMVYESLIFPDFEGISKEYVIDALVAKLEEGGFVDSRYILSVYKREAMGTLVLNKKIAIPHGLPEHVNKPALAIAKLSKPIFWDNEFMVDFVAMIAFKENNQDEMRQLFKILDDKNKIKMLNEATTKEEIADIFRSGK